MKPKMIRLFSLLAVFLCLTAFSTAAYAQTDDNDTGEEVITCVVYSDDETAETDKSTEPQSLTPEGNMGLVDDIDDEDADNMQFITVVSRNGNYFYIVIDRSGDGENTVHFLNQVDETDLLALMGGGRHRHKLRRRDRGGLYLHGKVRCRFRQYILRRLQAGHDTMLRRGANSRTGPHILARRRGCQRRHAARRPWDAYYRADPCPRGRRRGLLFQNLQAEVQGQHRSG